MQAKSIFRSPVVTFASGLFLCILYALVPPSRPKTTKEAAYDWKPAAVAELPAPKAEPAKAPEQPTNQEEPSGVLLDVSQDPNGVKIIIKKG